MYDSLINQINTYIRDNATNDISGGGLNTILRSMLDALGLGMRFYGIATTGTTPVSNQYPKFYIAFKPDNYSNFNIANYPKFTSGLAIIYDEDGTNTWLMAVKPFESNGTSGFLVNAQVRKNKYPADARFYIGNARVTNGLSTFTVYSTTENNLETDAIAAVFTSEEQLTGLMTHKVVGVDGTVFYVSVDWDKLIFNDETTFSYYETRFPSEAYVDTSDDVDFEEMLQPVYFDFNADVAISDITNQILQHSLTQQSIANLIEYKKLNKNVRFRLRYLDSGDLQYIDLQEFLPYVQVSFSEHTTDDFYILQETYEVTLVSKKNNEYFTIKFAIQHHKLQEDEYFEEQFYGTVTWNLENISNPQLVRTINNEILIGDKSNANLLDGFYFPNAVQDFDGNWYHAVIVGDQVWLTENLKSSHYSDGEAIPISNPNNDRYPYIYYPNGDSNNIDTYGYLYNWVAATRNENSNTVEGFIRGIAPGTEQNGDNIWHIPTYSEFQKLIRYLNAQSRYKANTCKATASTKLWSSGLVGTDADKNNITGLSIVPAGYCGNGELSLEFGRSAYFWSSTLSTDPSSGINVRIGGFLKSSQNATQVSAASSMMAYYKFSVRCISDLLPYQFRNWYIQQYGSLQHII